MCLMGKMYSKWSPRWECLRGRSRGGDDQGKIPQWDVLRGRYPRGDVLWRCTWWGMPEGELPLF